MFDVLREQFSLMFSRRWPSADGVITAVYVDPYDNNLQITYEFRLGDDGPYTGQSYPPFWFGGAGIMNTNSIVGQTVAVRYRHRDPSINTLDRSFWQELEGL